MKTENKKVNGADVQAPEKLLKEFEMIELKGGNSVFCNSDNINCTNINTHYCPDEKCSSSTKK